MRTYITTLQILRDIYLTSSISRTPAIQQCRAFNLMYSASTKTHLGNHKNIDYVPFKYSTKTACEIELWNDKPSAKIGQMTLHEALEKYIRPGVILLRKNESVKGVAPQSPEQYVLVNLKTDTLPNNLATTLEGHSYGRGAKQFYLHTWADMGYCRHLLERAYQSLKARLCVEFHVCEKRTGDIDFQSDSRLFGDLVHLRPEVIQRAMPEKSGIIIVPQTNYREYCWVVGPPRKGPGGAVQKPDSVTAKFYKNRRIQVKRKKIGGSLDDKGTTRR